MADRSMAGGFSSCLTRRFFRQILGRIKRLAGHPTKEEKNMRLPNARNHRLPALAALLVMLLGVGSAAAVPVNYNEDTDGPLPIHPSGTVSGGPTPGDFLTLDLGINTFSGSAIWSNEVPGRTTFDTAPVTLPAGMEILSLNLSVTNIGGTGSLKVVFPALALYERFGFCVTGENDIQYLMRRG